MSQTSPLQFENDYKNTLVMSKDQLMKMSLRRSIDILIVDKCLTETKLHLLYSAKALVENIATLQPHLL